MYVVLGLGDRNFSPPRLYPSGLRPKGMGLADFDLDGHLDVVTTNESSNSLTLYRNQLVP